MEVITQEGVKPYTCDWLPETDQTQAQERNQMGQLHAPARAFPPIGMIRTSLVVHTGVPSACLSALSHRLKSEAQESRQ